MAFVAINVLSVPEGMGSEMERRFAARAGAVDDAAGFLGFTLLRPESGSDDYLVHTRWERQEDFEAWRASQSFGQSHGGGGSGSPAASDARLWTFVEVDLDGGAADAAPAGDGGAASAGDSGAASGAGADPAEGGTPT